MPMYKKSMFYLVYYMHTYVHVHTSLGVPCTIMYIICMYMMCTVHTYCSHLNTYVRTYVCIYMLSCFIHHNIIHNVCTHT